MFVYEKKLQYPVKVATPNPKLAAVIISQYGGPDGELGASLRYLSQRYSMPYPELKGLLTDIGTEELGHLEMVGTIVHQLTRTLTDDQIRQAGFDAYFVDHAAGVYPTAAAGCVCTCASDMAKWLQFNLDKGKVDGKQLVREDLMQLLVTAHIDTGDGGAYKPQRSMTSYGLGWSLYNYRGHRMAEHGGNINGFTSSTAFVPDLNLGVFISVNMDVALIADAFVQETVDAVMGATDGNWYQRMLDNNKAMFDRVKKFYAAFGGTPVPNTQPSHPIGDYAGVYEAPGYRRFLITEKDGKLTADFNHFVVGLKHFHYDSFATEDTIGELPAGFVITFGANPKGEISTLSATLGSEQGLKPIIFTKAK